MLHNNALLCIIILYYCISTVLPHSMAHILPGWGDAYRFFSITYHSSSHHASSRNHSIHHRRYYKVYIHILRLHHNRIESLDILQHKMSTLLMNCVIACFPKSYKERLTKL